MIIWRAIATVFGCTLLMAAVGTSIGYAIGIFSPAYYRVAFHAGQDPGFDLVSVGMGQGMSQGAAGGVVIGLAIVALLTWREIRLLPGTDPSTSGSGLSVGQDMARQRMRYVLVVTCFLIALVFAGCVGTLCGLLIGERVTYHRRFLEEQQIVAPILAADLGYARVELWEYSGGGIALAGDVPTGADLVRLQTDIMRALGETRARQVLSAVRARQ